MGIDFSNLPIATKAGVVTFDIDDLIAACAEDPALVVVKQQLATYQESSKYCIEHTLRIMIPEFQSLSDRFKENPVRLKAELSDKIFHYLAKQDPARLEKIAANLGMDSSRFKNNQDFIKALSSKIYDDLTNLDDLSTALNTLDALKDLPELNSKGSLKRILAEIANGFAEVAGILAGLFNPLPPGPPSDPRFSLIFNQTARFSCQDSLKLVGSLREKQQNFEAKPSILEVFKSACEEFAKAAKEKSLRLTKLETLERSEKREKFIDRLRDILSSYPELADRLQAYLSDPHYRDGPITAGQKFIALQEAREGEKLD